MSTPVEDEPVNPGAGRAGRRLAALSFLSLAVYLTVNRSVRSVARFATGRFTRQRRPARGAAGS